MRPHKEPFFFNQYYHDTRFACSFKKTAKKLVNRDMIVLEAGCGKRSVIKECGLSTMRTIGLEILPEDLHENPAIDLAIVGSVESLPFRKNQFDLIICRNVVEHLPRPPAVFAEFERVLKPGGYLLIRTPNVLNPLMVISAILPTKTRSWLKKHLLHDQEGDTFPTYYRCNSARKLQHELGKTGFRDEYLGHDGLMAYFDFSAVVLSLIVLYEKLTDIEGLRKFKMWLIGAFRKISVQG